jgi:hypothetical protein
MNNIIIELCAEDRARLDRLAEALERKSCDACVAAALEWKGAIVKNDTPDEIQQKLAETLAKAEAPTETPKNAPEEAKAEPAPIDHPAEEELPWKADTPAEPTKPTVTLEQIQKKVMQLAAAQGGAKKAKVREIINAYGAKVSDLKDQPDKWDEVWGKLEALESEG